MKDNTISNVDTRIQEQQLVSEHIHWNPEWHIARYASQSDLKEQIVYKESEAFDLFGIHQFSDIRGNLLCTDGLLNLWELVATTGGTQYANANAYLGVGTDNTAATASDTALGANAVYKAMDTGYPAISGANNQTCTWQATYGSSDANQAWEEFAVFTSVAGANMLNHLISSQGTKSSGQTWQLQLAISLT